MTHLDNLRKYPNFILLCTSNLKNNIDPAFLDRLDVSFFVDFPSVATCFQILKNLTDEIIESKVVTPDENKPQITKIIGQLAIYSNKVKISGRSLSKLPFSCISENFSTFPVTLTQYLIALSISLSKYQSSQS
ncbi:protein PCH2 [Kluyveromyces marxianus]|uniref:Protein PCH2 n=1 Tax=Kluyveromyces marxianus TaxID=4911 RepID=A0ABX6EPB6_KLUMA|nr:protein PCH2 [Kluyveromyces marxianus]